MLRGIARGDLQEILAWRLFPGERAQKKPTFVGLFLCRGESNNTFNSL